MLTSDLIRSDWTLQKVIDPQLFLTRLVSRYYSMIRYDNTHSVVFYISDIIHNILFLTHHQSVFVNDLSLRLDYTCNFSLAPEPNGSNFIALLARVIKLHVPHTFRGNAVVTRYVGKSLLKTERFQHSVTIAENIKLLTHCLGRKRKGWRIL